MLGRILLTSPSDFWSFFFYSKSHDGRCASWLWYFLWQSPFWHWSSGEPQDKLCGCSKVSLVCCSHLLLQLGCAQGLLLFNSAPTTESCHSPHTCEVFAWMRTAWLMMNNDNNCKPAPPTPPHPCIHFFLVSVTVSDLRVSLSCVNMEKEIYVKKNHLL